MHFYPGITLRDYEEMDIQELEDFWNSITIIQAQDALTQMKVAVYPSLKKDAAAKVHKSFYEMAFPQVFEKKPSFMTFEGLARILGRGGK